MEDRTYYVSIHITYLTPSYTLLTMHMYMCRGLVLGYLDAGLKEEATKTLSAAILLARRGVPDQLVSLLKFQVLL